jgi:hypothetical protein
MDCEPDHWPRTVAFSAPTAAAKIMTSAPTPGAAAIEIEDDDLAGAYLAELATGMPALHDALPLGGTNTKPFLPDFAL